MTAAKNCAWDSNRKGRIPLYQLTDQEILADLLLAQSSLAEKYGAAALSSMHAAVRNAMLEQMNEEHRLHAAVAGMLEQRGYGRMRTADQKEIEQIRETLKQLLSARHGIWGS